MQTVVIVLKTKRVAVLNWYKETLQELFDRLEKERRGNPTTVEEVRILGPGEEVLIAEVEVLTIKP